MEIKKIVHSACQILFAYTSAVPLKLEDKSDVTDHDQKVDDCITPSDLRKRKLAKIQSFILITKQFVSVKRVKVIQWFCGAHTHSNMAAVKKN